MNCQKSGTTVSKFLKHPIANIFDDSIRCDCRIPPHQSSSYSSFDLIFHLRIHKRGLKQLVLMLLDPKLVLRKASVDRLIDSSR